MRKNLPVRRWLSWLLTLALFVSLMPAVLADDTGTVTITGDNTKVKVDKTIQLTATVADTTGTVSDVRTTWSSDDPSVATVDPDTGKVTGKAVGTVTITATCTYKLETTDSSGSGSGGSTTRATEDKTATGT